MDNSAIQTLEAAAQMLMAPPNLVSSEQRHQAESVFLQFRTTKNPYALCREILEKSSSDYVLFEAAGLLKSALIREWSLLSESDVSSLREYLLNYLLRKDTAPFLREKLLQTIAIIIKRGSVDDGGRERKALLTELEKIILSSTINQQKLACSLILAIMQEYAITVKSADVGMIWEVHFRLKKSFEALDLKRIFRFTVGVLEQIVRSGHRPEGEQAALTKQLLTIVETVLCWSRVSPLLSKRLIGAFEAIFESDTPALRLSLNWRDTMMQPELIALFFEIHMYVRSNPELANPSLTCLVQLASLCGVVLFGNLKQQYLENYVNSFLNMMAYIQPVEREMLGISDIYRKLVQFFSPAMVASTPPAFLENLTRLTCHCIRGAVIEEGVNDDTVWRESLNKFLHTWSSLVHDSDGYSNETLMNPCIEVFNTYLQCRLAPPDGTRGTESNDGCGDDIKDDIEEDERKQHANVLLTIGAIARKAPAHCSHVLFTLLQDRSKRLEGQLQLMHMGKLPMSGGEQLVRLFEDLHWILMITGHFLAIDCVEGELVMIPPEIMHYSLVENANVDASLRYLVGESTSTENVDPVLKLIGEILRISAWECAALEAGLGTVFSPELSATISWLLKIWANSYLMPPPLMYSEMSPILECAFGRGSRGVSWVVSRLGARAGCCLRHLAAQPVAATQALHLLTTLAHSQHKENPLATCEEFLALVAWEATGSNLPGELRKELHRAFAIAATYAEGEARNRLLSSTVALQEKLLNILNMESDTEPVRNMLADTLDCFIGVTEGVHEVGTMDEQFMMLMGALEKIPGIIFKYHNYPGVVLPSINLLTKSTKRMLNSVQPQNVTKFLEICNTTFEVYMRWNQGKISSIPQDAEEEAYEDICALMELICSISRCGSDRSVDTTCARGLRMLLPLVTPSLLTLPTLAAHMYRMIRDLDNFGADQITNLPIEEFTMVIGALRVGLTAVSCDVSTLCCDTIVGIANKVRNQGDDNPYAMALLTLAELLLMLIIKMEIPPDSIPAAGAAIYSLTCVKPALLEGLARQLIEAFAVNDPANVPRLEEAFGMLTNGVIFDGVRLHKIRFQDNFDKFLASVHGFLIIK
ncbi:exportin-4-like isoform X2 [Pectinophora gossypiella]|uniref:exportin-4-like isoform X2 n=1 Tax=Pectinophora gossypiella TaxID=13191 RepID=UPI00214EF249|nr:exportin-4-like isoform X2 [Pectinophora gossypiella]